SGKVALITGSSKSIGASIARALAAQGASVVINYAKDSRSAEEVAQQINLSLNSTSAIVVKADSSTISGGHYLLQETLRIFGRLDILVLNAGLMGSRTLSEIDEPFFNAHFDFNVKAPLFLVKEAAEVMIRSGGRIIFLSTSLTTASTLLPNALCYVASKGAVEQVARVLSKDLGTQGFTVNTVALGPVDTALFRAGTSQHVISSIAAQVPSHRIAEPDDITPIVAFLASPAAQWVNGQIIGVNGVSHNLTYTVE
ncbi:NAD-P-binding protein, partial [Lentinula aff. lateritia]